jgi:hypothetical protein
MVGKMVANLAEQKDIRKVELKAVQREYPTAGQSVGY